MTSFPDEKTPTLIFLKTLIFLMPKEASCPRSTVRILLPF